MQASAAELPRLGQFLISHGVTGYFATTVAAPLDSTCAALERLADAIERDSPLKVQIRSAPTRDSSRRTIS